jgi:hypothetical protein
MMVSPTSITHVADLDHDVLINLGSSAALTLAVRLLLLRGSRRRLLALERVKQVADDFGGPRTAAAALPQAGNLLLLILLLIIRGSDRQLGNLGLLLGSSISRFGLTSSGSWGCGFGVRVVALVGLALLPLALLLLLAVLSLLGGKSLVLARLGLLLFCHGRGFVLARDRRRVRGLRS